MAAPGSFGLEYSPASLRRSILEALAPLEGIRQSPELLSPESLPDSVKDRSYSVLVSASSSRGARYPETSVTQLDVTLTYAKLLKPLGAEGSSLTRAYDDAEAIFRVIMTEFASVEMAQETQSEPRYHRGGSDSQYLIIQQVYSCVVRRPHS